jgi:capsular polysaccharide biosynthesis protein
MQKPGNDGSEADGHHGSVIAELSHRLHRHFRAVLVTSLVFGLATAVTLYFAVPRSFEASSMLVVVTPKITSDLKPASLTVQGYQKLLESDAVIEETRRHLVEKGVLSPKDTFRLKDDLETRIFVSRYSENVMLAPMVQLIVRRPSAEQATAAANAWAEVFLVRARELMAISTASQVQFIDEQFLRSGERLSKRESERLTSAAAFGKRLNELTSQGDALVVELKAKTSTLIAEYETESKRSIADLAASTSVETRRSQLKAMRKAYFDLQIEQSNVTALHQQKKLRAEALRQQLAKVETFITLRKAITDDALWRSLAGDGKELDWKLLQEKSLLSQESNPIYRDLSGQLSQLEADTAALAPRSKQLSEELQAIGATIKETDNALRLDEVKLEKLTREREAGLEQLKDRRAASLMDLTRERQRLVEELTMERDMSFAQLDRGISQEKNLHTELAKNFNQSTLAKAQQTLEDVRLGAPAVPMDRPLPRGLTGPTLAMTLLGALVALIVTSRADHRPAPPLLRHPPLVAEEKPVS